MATPFTADHRRFDDLLPFYVAGTLPDTDREWVERWLDSHPDARTALDWHRAVGAVVDTPAAAVHHDVGWAGLAARLADEARAAHAPHARPLTSASWVDRLRNWLGSLAGAPAFAIAATVIVAQTVVIGTLLQRESADARYMATRGGAAAAELVLQVRFRADASEQDLRLLLNTAGARIVDGPDQLGEYLVVPRQGDLQALRDALRASNLVTHAEPFERKP